MNKIKKILILVFIVLIALLLRIPDRIDRIILTNVTMGIEKIGIVPVWLDNDEYKFIRKDEILIGEKKTISEIIRVINGGDIERNVKVDRLPAEYELYFYYNKEKVRALYWINCPNYNLNIDNITGEITVNGSKLDEIIQLLANAEERFNIEDPYYIDK